ncbi:MULTISPECIES: HupE/UreJ family protein [unclassified Neptuniibacter]|uniref:HupE/UreJ family protein n=1 Tax=unclassified Neptuniibacter TaxID=2630693 RepID=UPI0025F4FC39|nr:MULTISPECIES: HupE/UreJ family protein [unclassified Neptuniibacter]
MKKILTIVLLFFSSISYAHFTHFEPRILHIYQESEGTTVLMRMPLPLILLDESWKGIDSNENIPYTRQVNIADSVEYILLHEKIDREILTFKSIIEKGHSIKINGIPQTYKITSLHIFNSDNRKPFSSLETALENFEGPLTIDKDAIDLFDSGIDIKLHVPNTSLTKDDLSIISVLGDRFNAINRLANIVNLHIGDNQKSITTVGILDYSSIHPPSRFIKLVDGFLDGLSHILIGLDHVLFMVLLFFTATSFLRLFSLATAFTIGHSFSLILGNNLAVQSPIFIPGIEFVIALTIGLTAIALLFDKAKHLGTTPLLIIGIIHGFGFSFVFSELEKQGAQTDIASLAGFNIGIEVGQLCIYLIAFLLTSMINRLFSLPKPLYFYTCIITLAVTTYWMAIRSIPLLEYMAI